MVMRGISGKNILVVEDEYLFAMEVSDELSDSGANVVGPAASVGDALALVEKTSELDGAILDVNLRGEMVYEVADKLGERRIPYLFTTGYDSHNMPPRFAGVTRCEKPVRMLSLLDAVRKLVVQPDADNSLPTPA